MKSTKIKALLPRDGVSPSCVVVTGEHKYYAVDDFLTTRFPLISQDEWKKRLQAGDVFNEDGEPLFLSTYIKRGDKLFYFRELKYELQLDVREHILFEDEYILVADKPHFLPVTPSGKYVKETLLVRLKNKTSCEYLSPIHRIDRDTAGLVVFTKKREIRGAYQMLFQEKKIHKEYLAIAPWRYDVPEPFIYQSRLDRADNYMQQIEIAGEANSATKIELLEKEGRFAKYLLTPITGRRHQLRAHMNALHMPILGDGIYPILTPEGSSNMSRPLQLLAFRLAFIDPLTDQERSFQSEFNLMNWNEIKTTFG